MSTTAIQSTEEEVLPTAKAARKKRRAAPQAKTATPNWWCWYAPPQSVVITNKPDTKPIWQCAHDPDVPTEHRATALGPYTCMETGRAVAHDLNARGMVPTPKAEPAPVQFETVRLLDVPETTSYKRANGVKKGARRL